MSPPVSKDVVETVRHLQELAGYRIKDALRVLALPRSTWFDWAKTDGKRARPPACTPKSHHLLPEEREAVITFAHEHPEVGYRRLTYMMVDAGVAAVRPSTVYTILKQAGLIGRWKQPECRAHRKGFVQPEVPHEQWHTDIAYLNVCGTMFFLISVLDGYSRAIIHHDIRLSMETTDVEIVIQRAIESLPAGTAPPRLISDNGSQFVSAQFKTFLRQSGCAHSRARVRHPQSNGKIERWHQTIKSECTRRKALANLEEARQVVAAYVKDYNQIRLHSAIDFLTPAEALRGPEHVAARRAERHAAFQRADAERRARRKQERAA